MAYATVSYGTERSQSIDRFGTEQTYAVLAVNGKVTDHYRLVPERTDAVVKRMGLKVLGWVYSQFHGTQTYKLDMHERPLEILHSADGRVKITFDHRVVYREVKRTRPRDRRSSVVDCLRSSTL